jgi:DNA modification methylase
LIIDSLKPLEKDINSLKIDNRNARKHPVHNLEVIKRSLETYGQRKPIVVNQKTSTIEAGNGLYMAAKELGWDKIACVFVDDTKEMSTAYGLMDNQSALISEWDLPTLKDLLQELDTGELDMSITGFTSEELENLMTQVHQGLTDDDSIPEKVETVCKKGDLWQLGEHRLLCGDSTVITDAGRLMGGEKADLIWTDPPYGVSYGDKLERANPMGYRVRQIKNDNLTPDNLEEFLRASLSNGAVVSTDIASIYVASPPGTLLPFLIASFNGSGFDFRWQLIWLKDQIVLSRADYHFKHENILFGWKTGGTHYFTEDRKQCSVFEYPRPKASPEHPTMKPVELIAHMLNNSSKIGQLVLDLFGGSGSTLIACEKLSRKCRMMEIDEHYCDVIIKRWEDFTGQKAELING